MQGWGWWHLITGTCSILVAAALFSGATWARVVAVILVIIHAIGQLFMLPTQPWWSLIVLAIDILVIYALTVHGRGVEGRRSSDGEPSGRVIAGWRQEEIRSPWPTTR